MYWRVNCHSWDIYFYHRKFYFFNLCLADFHYPQKSGAHVDGPAFIQEERNFQPFQEMIHSQCWWSVIVTFWITVVTIIENNLEFFFPSLSDSFVMQFINIYIFNGKHFECRGCFNRHFFTLPDSTEVTEEDSLFEVTSLWIFTENSREEKKAWEFKKMQKSDEAINEEQHLEFIIKCQDLLIPV